MTISVLHMALAYLLLRLGTGFTRELGGDKVSYIGVSFSALASEVNQGLLEGFLQSLTPTPGILLPIIVPAHVSSVNSCLMDDFVLCDEAGGRTALSIKAPQNAPCLLTKGSGLELPMASLW